MDESEIRDLFDRYLEAFNRLDGEAAAACYSAPSFVVKEGGVERIEPVGKSSYFKALMESNSREGDHHWEIAEFEVAAPATNGAIVTVRWTGRRTDASTIWDFKDTYVLGNDGSGWHILGDIVHDGP